MKEDDLFDWDSGHVEGIDFYLEDGKKVMTESYLKRRGKCCHNQCRHCPYGYKPPENDLKKDKNPS